MANEAQKRIEAGDYVRLEESSHWSEKLTRLCDIQAVGVVRREADEHGYFSVEFQALEFAVKPHRIYLVDVDDLHAEMEEIRAEESDESAPSKMAEVARLQAEIAAARRGFNETEYGYEKLLYGGRIGAFESQLQQVLPGAYAECEQQLAELRRMINSEAAESAPQPDSLAAGDSGNELPNYGAMTALHAVIRNRLSDAENQKLAQNWNALQTRVRELEAALTPFAVLYNTFVARKAQEAGYSFAVWLYAYTDANRLQLGHNFRAAAKAMTNATSDK